MARKRGYTGDYFYKDTSDFYIHQHMTNIGRAAKGAAMNDMSLAQLISNQKQAASLAAKSYYQKMYLENLTLPEEEMTLLKGAFEEDIESMIRVIDEQVKQQMFDIMNRDSLQDLRKAQKDAVAASKGLLSSDTREAIASFNSVLDSLANASKLIESPLGADLAILLQATKYKNSVGMNDMQNMGQKLNHALQGFIERNKIAEINDDRIKLVLTSLGTFAESLYKGQTKSKKKKLTEDNITNIVDTLFNPGFAEVVASQVRNIADFSIENAALLTGTKTYQTELTDEFGKVIGFDSRKPAAGKVDFKFENVAVDLKHDLTREIGNIELNIGISNKFYRANGFYTGKGKMPKIEFSSGSGGTLKEAIDSIFSGDRTKYLIYNVLAHQEHLDASIAALNDVILTRQINKLFASRGGSADFAQYIFVNGEVISILQLIDYVTNPANSLGKSKSMAEKGDTQAIMLSMKGRPALMESVKITNALRRTKAVNGIINSSTISAHVHVNKLLQSLTV